MNITTISTYTSDNNCWRFNKRFIGIPRYPIASINRNSLIFPQIWRQKLPTSKRKEFLTLQRREPNVFFTGIPKHRHKPRFDERIKFFKARLCILLQLANLIQHRRDTLLRI